MDGNGASVALDRALLLLLAIAFSLQSLHLQTISLSRFLLPDTVSIALFTLSPQLHLFLLTMEFSIVHLSPLSLTFQESTVPVPIEMWRRVLRHGRRTN
jgi:hypothetical protein